VCGMVVNTESVLLLLFILWGAVQSATLFPQKTHHHITEKEETRRNTVCRHTVRMTHAVSISSVIRPFLKCRRGTMLTLLLVILPSGFLFFRSTSTRLSHVPRTRCPPRTVWSLERDKQPSTVCNLCQRAHKKFFLHQKRKKSVFSTKPTI
jgi:hypothetical protein